MQQSSATAQSFQEPNHCRFGVPCNEPDDEPDQRRQDLPTFTSPAGDESAGRYSEAATRCRCRQPRANSSGSRLGGGPRSRDTGRCQGWKWTEQPHHALGVVGGEVCALPFVDAGIDARPEVVGPQLRTKLRKAGEQRRVQDALSSRGGMKGGVAPEEPKRNWITITAGSPVLASRRTVSLLLAFGPHGTCA
jgi:hypothetical protein